MRRFRSHQLRLPRFRISASLFEGGDAMRRALSLGFLVGLVAVSLRGQSPTGAIAGTVVDASGGGVPGVTLTAAQAETGATRTAYSTATGTFRIPLLSVGTYSVTAEISGFKTAKVANVVVTVGGEAAVKMTMELESVQAAVVVSSQAPLIETTKTEVDSPVNEKMIQNLPVNGRNFEDFVLTTPGVVTDVRLGDISFAGQRGTLNSLVVDGADNNNTFFGQALGRTGSGRAPYQFSQDAVEEFQVNTNGYSAEFGRAGGAVVNVVTKSGTNEFHGSAFEFYRDKSLNANTFFNNAAGRFTSDPTAGPPSLVVPPGSPTDGKLRRPVPALHVNQFGGNVGGPIVKDKAFFFFDYDGQRRVDPVDEILGGTRVGPSDPNFAAQQLALSQIASHTGTYPRLFNQNVYLLKGDWQMTASNRFSARWNHQ